LIIALLSLIGNEKAEEFISSAFMPIAPRPLQNPDRIVQTSFVILSQGPT